MKKLFLVGAIALTSLSVSAQEGLKGTWFAGGQIAFGSDKTSEKALKGNAEFKSTTILPIVGTFITPSVAIGAGVGFMGTETKVDGVKMGKGENIVIKPLARKYWNITGGLFFFGQAAVPMIFGTTKSYTYTATGKNESKTTTSNVKLELSPGFDYVINKWLTIETSFRIFSVGFDSVKPDGGSSESSFNFNANPFNSVDDREMGNLQIGVKFLF